MDKVFAIDAMKKGAVFSVQHVWHNINVFY